MTAKSETVGVDSVWIRRVDVGTDNECSFVCHLLDPGAVEFVPESALAELKMIADNRLLLVHLTEQKLTTLISGLEALAGELDLQKFNYAAARIRALIPAAANTESEEGHGRE